MTSPAARLPADAAPALLARAAPAAFVLIWSTGFVVARYAMPYAQPLAFLALRYALSLVAFAVWILVTRPTWPGERMQWLHLGVTGVLIQAGYLGGVWCAVKHGLGAGMAALIVGLQPVLTAIWVSASGKSHHVSRHQWGGLALGLAGLVLVLQNKLQLGLADPANVAMALTALASITVGTLYQKRWVAPCDVRTANTVQLLAALLVTLPLALMEPVQFEVHPALVWALAWSVLVLTLGGSSLLYLLIHRGAAMAVSSLMYLVPPCAALLAWWLFDEPLTPKVLAGLALTAAGVALVLRERPLAAVPRPS